METNEKPRICDVVNYNQDIEPFSLVKIYSGVGSGKSFFAASMITGSKKYNIPKQNVLVITSRRAKVEETLKELGIHVKPSITYKGNLSTEIWQSGEDSPWEYEEYLKRIKIQTVLGEMSISTYNKSVICTNAYISAYLKNVYDPKDPMTHIWNKFDAIIVDEVHSLVTDSTYQSATFDVLELIREYLTLNQNKQLQEDACKRIILMSGTPQPFDFFAELDFPKKLTNELELFEKCKNVVPKNVVIIDHFSAQKRIKELLCQGKKAIYFTNHIPSSESAVRERFSISDDIDIGFSFSNDKKKNQFSQKERKRMKEIDESLSQNSHIPDNIQFFVTTSRNKEGINIHNEDIQNMFVETHLMYDAVQMAGRVRCGLDTLYIISDADQLNNGNSVTEIRFSKQVMVANKDIADSQDKANRYLTTEYIENPFEIQKSAEDRRRNIMHYIRFLESRFDYVQYNVFRQRFDFFHIKEEAEKLAARQVIGFQTMLASDNNKMVEAWFPNSVVQRELSPKEQAFIYLKNLIGKNPYIKLSREERETHCSVICNILQISMSSFQSVLHRIDTKFNCKESGEKYILYYGENDPRVKRAAMKKRRKR